MSNHFSYFTDTQHLPKEVQIALKKMPYKRRKRLLILVDLGVNLTMEHINEYNSLTRETDIDRFARRLIF